MKIYLDNAATTQLDSTVFQEMEPYLFESYGNPSSSHAAGRAARTAIEASRRTIADLLNAAPENIVFTSGGTEADNTAIISTVRSKGIKLVISSKFEHHAVLNTLKYLEQRGEIRVVFLKHDDNGTLSLSHLEQLLAANEKALVSLMHANNELGNLIDIQQVGALCKSAGAIFHSDTVQSICQYQYDTQTLPADFLVASAHKFHGPKGVGFLYARDPKALTPFLHGGAQERGLRSGTENVSGIVGMAKALSLSYANQANHQQHLSELKEKMINNLISKIPGIRFNGNSARKKLSLNNVLNVALPLADSGQDVLSFLDQHEIYASGGSACSAKSNSHVLSALGVSAGLTNIRFSFSRYTTEEELEYTVDLLSGLYVNTALKEMSTIC
ncbi:cysteine desulfurase family protein [Pedobacter sp. GR22-6]|uniref:cysteine desulfurase family protein n=1 Tax=Pedobacter sp. GR22-6 TaxID=3127957 RepID=UPI00307FAEC4